MATTLFTCPKCGAPMSQYNRNDGRMRFKVGTIVVFPNKTNLNKSIITGICKRCKTEVELPLSLAIPIKKSNI